MAATQAILQPPSPCCILRRYCAQHPTMWLTAHCLQQLNPNSKTLNLSLHIVAPNPPQGTGKSLGLDLGSGVLRATRISVSRTVENETHSRRILNPKPGLGLPNPLDQQRESFFPLGTQNPLGLRAFTVQRASRIRVVQSFAKKT
jgi:hypothetical protein